MREQNGHIAYRVSRRKIGEIMKKHDLISKYTLKRVNNKKSDVNNDDIENMVSRDFNDRGLLEVVVSDLTYVRICGLWHYICLLLDLCGRKIIGFAVGRKKDSQLVKTAFYRVQADLREINIFHTDRGGEFKNKVIEDILKAFGIKRSLSAKGTPIDNAVAESMYNILKIEFVYGESFKDLDELELKLFDYVNWYNNVRIHGSLGYITPAEYEQNKLKSANSFG